MKSAKIKESAGRIKSGSEFSLQQYKSHIVYPLPTGIVECTVCTKTVTKYEWKEKQKMKGKKVSIPE